MALGIFAGGVAGIYVERALRRGWDAEIVFTTKLVVSVGVTTGVIAALFWLIGRLNKSP
ncbi:MAG: hypothetical protein QM820_55600 [Minicystis sp.]